MSSSLPSRTNCHMEAKPMRRVSMLQVPLFALLRDSEMVVVHSPALRVALRSRSSGESAGSHALPIGALAPGTCGSSWSSAQLGGARWVLLQGLVTQCVILHGTLDETFWVARKFTTTPHL